MNSHTRNAALVGIGTAFFSGLTGVGGGPVLASLMVSVLGMDQHRAQGTTPAVILPIALVGAAAYLFQGLTGQFAFDVSEAVKLILALGLPGVIGVLIGAVWMQALPAAQLRRVFGVFLVFISVSMMLREFLPIGESISGAAAVPLIFWVLLGFTTGIISGFLGIGGAMFLVPFMALGGGLPQHMTQGISLAVVSITTLVSTVANYRVGNIDAGAVRAMAPGSVIAVILSSFLAGQLDAFWLTKIFALVMLYFAYQFTFAVRSKPAVGSAPAIDPSGGFYNI